MFEVDTLSEVWYDIEIMLCNWFMDVYDIGGTDAQLFIEQLQHGYGKSFSDYGYVLILLNRLEIFLDQIFIHIQLLLDEDQVVMEILTRMASWL